MSWYSTRNMFGIKTKVIRSITLLVSKSLHNPVVVSDLMAAFHVDEYGHQADLQKKDLGYGWIHYGLVRQQKPKNILCVGSRHGYIPALLAQACKDNGFGYVDFVDAGFDENNTSSWTGVGYWQTNTGKKSFRAFGLGNYISLYLQTTLQYAKQHPNKKFQYIYIDGDHSLEGVVLDFSLFYPMLEKGGFMVFHDISVKGVKPEGEYGVWKLWEVLKRKYGGIHIEFSGSGLGIIQK